MNKNSRAHHDTSVAHRTVEDTLESVRRRRKSRAVAQRLQLTEELAAVMSSRRAAPASGHAAEKASRIKKAMEADMANLQRVEDALLRSSPGVARL